MSLFKRSFRSHGHSASAGAPQNVTTPRPSTPSGRVDKGARLKKTGQARAADAHKTSKLQRSFSHRGDDAVLSESFRGAVDSQKPAGAAGAFPIVTLSVGREGRLFAAHEDTLCQAPFFQTARRGMFLDSQQPGAGPRLALPDEEPEVFSAILEYLYKGDYYPRLLHNKHRNSWELEDSLLRPSPNASPALTENLNIPGRAAAAGLGIDKSPFSDAGSSPRVGPTAVEPTVFLSAERAHVLRDTAIYCAADRYGLDGLKNVALRKQGLQAGIDVATIMRSAQYAYANTPDSDSRLRAHYLALIIRCRRTFKRSGTMQAEMERGGSKLFFDLFVAMCNHLDDVIEAGNKGTPRTI